MWRTSWKRRLSGLLLSLALMVPFCGLPVAAQSLPASPTQLPGTDSLNYHSGDVAFINTLIATNGLSATPNDPGSWGEFVQWSQNPQSARIIYLDLSYRRLSGALDFHVLDQLQTLDLSINPNATSFTLPDSLTFLKCSYMSLSSLPALPSGLQVLNCSSNRLSSLPSLPATLTSLDISSNNFTSLPTLPSGLEILYCNNNQISALDISSLSSLTHLYCSRNNITSLNVSGLSNLNTIACYDNQISSLNASACTELEYLDCAGNRLTDLNLADCTQLQSLWCDDNQLSSLDVSHLTSLEVLETARNQLSSLDLSNLNSLDEVYATDNQLTSIIWPSAGTLTRFSFNRNYNLAFSLSSLRGLSSLKSASFDSTAVQGDISALSGLDNLEWIWAQNSSITGKVSSLGYKANLTGIYVNGTAVTGTAADLALFPALRWWQPFDLFTGSTAVPDRTIPNTADSGRSRGDDSGDSRTVDTTALRQIRQSDVTVDGNRITVQGQNRLGFVGAFYRGDRIEGVKAYDGSCIVVLPDSFLRSLPEGKHTVTLQFVGAQVDVEIQGGASAAPPAGQPGHDPDPAAGTEPSANANANPSTGR